MIGHLICLILHRALVSFFSFFYNWLLARGPASFFFFFFFLGILHHRRFDSEFWPHRSALRERMVFVCTGNGDVIATATAWHR